MPRMLLLTTNLIFHRNCIRNNLFLFNVWDLLHYLESVTWTFYKGVQNAIILCNNIYQNF